MDRPVVPHCVDFDKASRETLEQSPFQSSPPLESPYNDPPALHSSATIQRQASSDSDSSISESYNPRRAISCPPDTLHPINVSLPHQKKGVAIAWLEPSTHTLPVVFVHRKKTVAIGRGVDAVERLKSLDITQQGSGGSNAATSPTTTNQEDEQESTQVVEVPDGRVSRVHCLIEQQKKVEKTTNNHHHHHHCFILKDVSSNGTFLNGNKLGRGVSMPLKSGDKISLVISVAPLAEVSYIFHIGEPPRGIAIGANVLNPLNGVESPPTASSPKRAATQMLRRSATSTYVSAGTASAQDLQCQICLEELKNSVAIEPCGHSFCAVCLSHHLSSLLLRGQALICPFRCATPERVVANTVARQILASTNTSPSIKNNSITIVPEEKEAEQVSTEDDDNPTTSELEMHPLCPLDDALLPLDLTEIKTAQLRLCMIALSNTTDPAPVLSSLENLARLAWSDESVRDEVRETGGLDAITQAMMCFDYHEGVQCNGCLALMALVRGDGPASSLNRWHIAVAGGLETILTAMGIHAMQPMVQLSGLLTLVPMALEDDHIQLLICQEGLDVILDVLMNHADESDIVAKALLALGALGQGDSEASQEVIKKMMQYKRVPKAIKKALIAHGSSNDEVLWASLFLLAVLAKQSGNDAVERVVNLASIGLSKPLQQSVDCYKEQCREQELEPDDMVITAGDFILDVLGKAHRLIVLRRLRVCTWLLTLGVAVTTSIRLYKRSSIAKSGR